MTNQKQKVSSSGVFFERVVASLILILVSPLILIHFIGGLLILAMGFSNGLFSELEAIEGIEDDDKTANL